MTGAREPKSIIVPAQSNSTATECPPDRRIRVLPLDTRSSLIEVKGYLAVRTERKRMPLIRQSLAIAKTMAKGRRALGREARSPGPDAQTMHGLAAISCQQLGRHPERKASPGEPPVRSPLLNPIMARDALSRRIGTV